MFHAVPSVFPKDTDFRTVTSEEVKTCKTCSMVDREKRWAFIRLTERFSELLAEKGEAEANELMLR